MTNNDFTVFILTHGRAENVITYATLKLCGYTGKVFLVVDDGDKQLEKYKEIYGDEVLVFNKAKILEQFDIGDHFEDDRVIIFARNVCYELAKELGITYYIQLDDDYTTFAFKQDENLKYKETRVKNLDNIFDMMLRFYIKTPTLTIAFAQNGDFIGGKMNQFARKKKLYRKCMNTFICSTERPFRFVGRINEDVNTYVLLGGQGKLLFTFPMVVINQKQTQTSEGGMSDIYLLNGTYLKSFYTVMYNPSCAKIGTIGHGKGKRLHHRVSWNNAVPKILEEKYKKK